MRGIRVRHLLDHARAHLCNRYPSMQDFLEDLERLSGDRRGAIVGPASIWDDVYEPQTAFSKNIATLLRKKAKLPS